MNENYTFKLSAFYVLNCRLNYGFLERSNMHINHTCPSFLMNQCSTKCLSNHNFIHNPHNCNISQGSIREIQIEGLYTKWLGNFSCITVVGQQLRTLRQKDHKFKISLNNLVRPCLRIKSKNRVGECLPSMFEALSLISSTNRGKLRRLRRPKELDNQIKCTDDPGSFAMKNIISICSETSMGAGLNDDTPNCQTLSVVVGLTC